MFLVNNMKVYFLLLTLLGVGLTSCNHQSEPQEEKLDSVQATRKIVSLSGTISEILVALGAESDIVGVDVTTTYPSALSQLPRVGHNRKISTEGVISLAPTLVIGTTSQLTPEAKEQIEGAGAEVLLLEQDFSVAGSKKLIQTIGAFLKEEAAAKKLTAEIDAKLAGIEQPETPPRVLFIYARGAGTLMVAGTNTQMDQMIALAGGQNVATDFTDFKPLTPEALVTANPEIVLLFSSGVESLAGLEGVKAIPGMDATIAGQNGNFVSMDGQLLAGFGPRLGLAVSELNAAFNSMQKQGTLAQK